MAAQYCKPVAWHPVTLQNGPKYTFGVIFLLLLQEIFLNSYSTDLCCLIPVFPARSSALGLVSEKTVSLPV